MAYFASANSTFDEGNVAVEGKYRLTYHIHIVWVVSAVASPLLADVPDILTQQSVQAMWYSCINSCCGLPQNYENNN